jgi:hypothetical protein
MKNTVRNSPVKMFSAFWFSAIILFLFFPSNPVAAESNCGEVARAVQVKFTDQGNAKGFTTQDEVVAFVYKFFEEAFAEYPDCKQELSEVYTWNMAGDSSVPFPFPKSESPKVGDSKEYPLGPISWWWEKIYVDLFNRNGLLFFIFGWEIFLIPIGMLLSLASVIVVVPFQFISSIAKRKKKNQI